MVLFQLIDFEKVKKKGSCDTVDGRNPKQPPGMVLKPGK